MFRLDRLLSSGGDPDLLPHTVKILLENLLRRSGTPDVPDSEVLTLLRWPEGAAAETTFMPARILMQDLTGVPALVDLAAMRSALARAGGDPAHVNPVVPVDLVVDHSIRVDSYGTAQAYATNLELEYGRNAERYALLRWAEQEFGGLRVVPPGAGIVHQVNLEYLARVVRVRDRVAMPDTVVGTDSHTTMIGGLGVLGWGVGGIEAEAVILGRPLTMPWPVVVGVRVVGALRPGVTATDLVLTATETLRAHGVVGKFVEFTGPGLANLDVADRATVANMCPEYGATAAYFPVDAETLAYLRATAREDAVDLVERYTKEQGLFRGETDPEPRFSELVELDLSLVEPSMSGPSRPQDRVSLAGVRESFARAFPGRSRSPRNGIGDGSVVIAAITGCTNTSNPSVMLAAGLLARKAAEAGLRPKPWVKTSLAPGSRVVSDYLDRVGLTPYLEQLGFHLVGYGCTTCIGNSGPLADVAAEAVVEHDLAVAAVISGNRNFEGRVHPQVKASYLASPPLVVAFALAGRIDLDITSELIGTSADGKPVRLEDVWPTPEEVRAAMAAVVPGDFASEYARIFEGDERWRAMATPGGPLYGWDESSTYVKQPPFFGSLASAAGPFGGIADARVLVMAGDSVTTDHISPAGPIAPDSPAGRYLQGAGVRQGELDSYGSRRGNHEVMVRGTFANARFRNALVPDREGPWTLHLPDGRAMSTYDAATRYREERTPLLVLAGKEYGSGSSRDWAAKGPALLGVRAVLAESFERIHRSNLLGMGILPLQFLPGESAGTHALSGRETYTIPRLGGRPAPRAEVVVEVRTEEGGTSVFPAIARLDVPAEVECYLQGGILPMVARHLLQERQ